MTAEKVVELVAYFGTQFVLHLLVFFLIWKILKYCRRRFIDTKRWSMQKLFWGATNLICFWFGLGAFLNVILFIPKTINKVLVHSVKHIEPIEFIADVKDANLIYEKGCEFLFGLSDSKKDFDKARKYFELSAEKGFGKAFFMLGFLYKSGLGVDIDIKKAVGYLQVAVEKYDYKEASTLLGKMYLKGDKVAQDVKKGLHYLNLAASKGCCSSAFFLGEVYEKDTYANMDLEKAKEYFKIAAKENINAISRLGLILLEEKKFAEAKEKLEFAAKSNDNDALAGLGEIYVYGLGVEKDYSKGFEYFELAAEGGSIRATTNLGILYIIGLGCEKDFPKGKDYLDGISPFSKTAKELVEILENSNNIDITIEIFKNSLIKAYA